MEYFRLIPDGLNTGKIEHFQFITILALKRIQTVRNKKRIEGLLLDLLTDFIE